MFKKCPVCGKEFKATNKHKQYCSTACAKLIRRSNIGSGELPDSKTCPVCKKSFKPSSGHQKYCSVKCRRRGTLLHLYEKNKRAGDDVPLICQRDGETNCLTCSKERCRYG